MNSIRILLVEDNEGDIILTLEALDAIRLQNPIQVVRDGEQAINYLNKQGIYADAETPDLILLDINMPRIDGRELLRYIKSHERFKMIPVVILTSSSSERDVKAMYTEYANCYITKPVDFSRFMQVMNSINSFWFNLVKLPSKNQE